MRFFLSSSDSNKRTPSLVFISRAGKNYINEAFQLCSRLLGLVPVVEDKGDCEEKNEEITFSIWVLQSQMGSEDRDIIGQATVSLTIIPLPWVTTMTRDSSPRIHHGNRNAPVPYLLTGGPVPIRLIPYTTALPDLEWCTSKNTLFFIVSELLLISESTAIIKAFCTPSWGQNSSPPQKSTRDLHFECDHNQAVSFFIARRRFSCWASPPRPWEAPRTLSAGGAFECVRKRTLRP